MRQYLVLFILVLAAATDITAQNVGINNDNPQHPMHINEAMGVSLASGMPVVFGEYKGVNLGDVIGVKGYSRPNDYYGIGGSFEGGWQGVVGIVNATGFQLYTGVLGQVSGGSGTNLGIYGSATGAGTNWAGYFGDGHVFVQNRLGIGQSVPLWPLDISAPQAVARLTSTNTELGSVLELRNTYFADEQDYIGAINFVNPAGIVHGQIGYLHDGAMIFNGGTFERIRITSFGLVGINTNNPQYQLDVSGDINATGAIRVNGVDIQQKIGFKARLVNSIVVNSGTEKIVNNLSEIFDDGNAFDPVTGLYTIPASGSYHFIIHANWISVSTYPGVVTHIRVYIDGTRTYTYVHDISVGANSEAVHFSFFDAFTSGQTVQIKVYQVNIDTAPLDLYGGGDSFDTFISGYRVH